MGTARKTTPRTAPAPRKRLESVSLADALFTTTQQRLLALLFGQPDRAYSVNELIRLARSGTGAVQREIARLDHSGIVTVTSIEGRKRVQANPATPIFEELRGLIEKTTGVAAVLRKTLERVAGRLRVAILYGSIAKGTDVSASDIDVLIVSDDLTQEEVFTLFEPAEQRLDRKISPTIYTRDEFARRRRAHNPFIEKVLAGKHVVLVGSLNDVGAREPGRDRDAEDRASRSVGDRRAVALGKRSPRGCA